MLESRGAKLFNVSEDWIAAIMVLLMYLPTWIGSIIVILLGTNTVYIPPSAPIVELTLLPFRFGILTLIFNGIIALVIGICIRKAASKIFFIWALTTLVWLIAVLFLIRAWLTPETFTR